MAHESLNRVTGSDGLVLPITREGVERGSIFCAWGWLSRSEVQSAPFRLRNFRGSGVMADAETVETCAMVSVDCHPRVGDPGWVWGDARPDVGGCVLQVADSPLSLSRLVHENDTQRAVQARYAQLIAGASLRETRGGPTDWVIANASGFATWRSPARWGSSWRPRS